MGKCLEMVLEGRPTSNRPVSGTLRVFRDTKKVAAYTHNSPLPFPELFVLAEPWMFSIP